MVFNKTEPSTFKIIQSAINAVVANNQSAGKTTDFNKMNGNIPETIQRTVNTTANKEAGGNTSVFNQPVVNTPETVQPTMNAVVNNQPPQPAQNSSVLKQLAVNSSYNNQPAEGAVVNNQVSNNRVIYNSETLGNNLSYPQTTNAVPGNQSDEYIGVCGQSMKGKFVYSYPRALYGDVNTSISYGSTTMNNTTPQGSSVEMLGTLMQPVKTYGLHTVGFGQIPLNTTSQESHPSEVDTPVCSNTHNIRSTGSEDTSGRTTSERRTRDPRKSRSRLLGRKADVRGDAGPVRKRPRLESTLREDSRANNYQGVVSF